MSALSRTLSVLLASYVFVYIIFCSLQITQVDIWWQLSEGFHILHTFSLPTQPAASFSLPATPYFDEYAGYEVILALIYKIGGFPVLWILFSAVYLLIIFLPIVNSGKKYPAFDILSILSYFAAGILMKSRLEERPELAGELLLVLMMVLLAKSRFEELSPNFYIRLFLIFFAWTNVHSSFVIGLFALVLWVGCELVSNRKRLTEKVLWERAFLVMILAALATIINPYGPSRLLFPFLQAFDPGSTALSPEMWPITDFSSITDALVIVAGMLLAFAFLTSRRTPLWLLLFSIFSFYMALKHFRFVGILAISLLFVYSSREISIQRSVRPRLIVLAKNMGLCLLCNFMLFAGSFNLLSIYGDLKSQKYLATYANPYAPNIVDQIPVAKGQPVSVLCSHGEGAYLSFGQNGDFHPLLDSGLAHFSDESKRYFFFLWNEPEALAQAAEHLKVNYVLLDRNNFCWIMTLTHLPDMAFICCDEDGMLWERKQPGSWTLTPGNRKEIEKSRDLLLQHHQIIRAFCYSTLLGRPSESLALLSQSDATEWSEPFFNYFSNWIALLPTSTIQDFLSQPSSQHYSLLNAVLWERLGPGPFESFVKANPPDRTSWQEKLVRARSDLQGGKIKDAVATFNSISPRPIASNSYYTLWHALGTAHGEVPSGDPGSYGKWQTWDEAAVEFTETMTARLNARMSALDSLADSKPRDYGVR